MYGVATIILVQSCWFTDSQVFFGMIIQIYEIQTPREAEKCIEAGVDHLGSVVLSEDEWRDPRLRETVRMIQNAGKKSSLIPLFRHKENIYRTLDYHAPDYVHFCDNLAGPDRKERGLTECLRLQEELKDRFPEVGIMRSIPVPPPGEKDDFPTFSLAGALEPLSDIFLTDTWLPDEPVRGFIGITGQIVDHEIARELVARARVPVILAGGLSPENVREALLEVLPWGVDSCTGTNERDQRGRPVRFQKDADRVREFVREVRMAEETLNAKREELEKKLEDLKERLRDREAALPAHSVRPHQLMVIEELEEEIEEVEKQISRLNLP